jgi:hypothetical protein
MIYLRDRLEWPEVVCAENRFGFHNHQGEIIDPDREQAGFLSGQRTQALGRTR